MDVAQLIALNGFMLYVTDVTASVDFYEKLGFIVVQREQLFGSVRLDNFLVHFQDKSTATDPDFAKEALAEPKGGGLFIYVQVNGIDQYFSSVNDKGITPATKPRDWPWGNREFVVRDPDGYKVVFYEQRGARDYGQD